MQIPYNTGPDELVEADSIFSFNINKGVKIDLSAGSSDPSGIKPISVPTLLLNASRIFSEETALGM